MGMAGARVETIKTRTQTLCCKSGPVGFSHLERHHPAANITGSCHMALTTYEVTDNNRSLIRVPLLSPSRAACSGEPGLPSRFGAFSPGSYRDLRAIRRTFAGPNRLLPGRQPSLSIRLASTRRHVPGA